MKKKHEITKKKETDIRSQAPEYLTFLLLTVILSKHEIRYGRREYLADTEDDGYIDDVSFGYKSTLKTIFEDNEIAGRSFKDY